MQKKGYTLIGSNSQGINAYFVRNDKLGDIPSVTVEDGYVISQIRESKDKNGNLTFTSGIERLRLMEEMNVYDIEKDAIVKIRDLYAKELDH